MSILRRGTTPPSPPPAPIRRAPVGGLTDAQATRLANEASGGYHRRKTEAEELAERQRQREAEDARIAAAQARYEDDVAAELAEQEARRREAIEADIADQLRAGWLGTEDEFAAAYPRLRREFLTRQALERAGVPVDPVGRELASLAASPAYRGRGSGGGSAIAARRPDNRPAPQPPAPPAPPAPLTAEARALASGDGYRGRVAPGAIRPQRPTRS